MWIPAATQELNFYAKNSLQKFRPLGQDPFEGSRHETGHRSKISSLIDFLFGKRLIICVWYSGTGDKNVGSHNSNFRKIWKLHSSPTDNHDGYTCSELVDYLQRVGSCCLCCCYSFSCLVVVVAGVVVVVVVVVAVVIAVVSGGVVKCFLVFEHFQPQNY